MQRCFIRFGSRHIELVEAEALVVGRAHECAIVVDDASASRRHCRFVFESGRVRVVDLESRNGVRLNGELIRGGRDVRDGDVVSVGTLHLSIHERGPRPMVARQAKPTTGGDQSTLGGPEALQIFAIGARDALRDGNMVIAEMGVRSLLTALGKQAKRNASLEKLVAATVDLTLDLAAKRRQRAWLEELDDFVETLGAELTEEQRGRYAALDGDLA